MIRVPSLMEIINKVHKHFLFVTIDCNYSTSPLQETGKMGGVQSGTIAYTPF